MSANNYSVWVNFSYQVGSGCSACSGHWATHATAGVGLDELLAAESKYLNAVKIANAANAAKPLAGQGKAEKPKQQAVTIKIISAKWGGGQNWADAAA